MESHLQYIVESTIRKTSEMVVCIPTCNSYEVTRGTLAALYEQRGVAFDVLLIDNHSGDHIRLAKDFPALNIAVLSKNTGSGGAQRVAGELALHHGYAYVAFSDNDALLIDPYALRDMLGKLRSDERLGAVVPRNREVCADVCPDYGVSGWVFHYLLVKASVLREVGLHDFHLFLYCDDLCLTHKISSRYRLLVCGSVFYTHPLLKSGYFYSFRALYFHLSGYLHVIFRERGLLWPFRLRLLCGLLLRFFTYLVFYARGGEAGKYLKTYGMAVADFICWGRNRADLVPRNTWLFCETPCETGVRYTRFSEKFVNFPFMADAISVNTTSAGMRYFRRMIAASHG